MLNLSHNKIEGKLNKDEYRSFSLVRDYKAARLFKLLLIIFFFLLVIVIFLPWTQFIRSRGYVTTLHPDQRPQTIHSIIGGRIEQWFVREGDFVNKGDTILFISEIKDEYFDPQLLERTEEQIKSKEMTVSSYMEKVKALDNQIDALLVARRLKLEQGRNMVRQAELLIESDSIGVLDATTNYDIAVKQLERMQQLYDDGLKSLTDLEARKLKVQESLAKKISAENKLLTSKNKMINTKVELVAIENRYQKDLAKTESEKYTALSSLYDSEAIVTKMQNQYMNYSVRSGFYYITSPQNGYITQTIRSGIGETVKEGEELVSIMPDKYDLAVSMYIRPMDLPLLNLGQPIRFMFDGWPTIVFSGWPNLSYGTFGGEVVAIDNFISPNGKYRILVAPDPNDVQWPEALRVGSGANGLILLSDVPIWYEIWRNLNGFPPDFYQNNEQLTLDKSK